MMGGLGAHEYMAPCAAGEDEIVLGRAMPRTSRSPSASPGSSSSAGSISATASGSTVRAGDRGRATSSSSARATPSRWARPTSTRRAPSWPIWMASYGIGPARLVAAAVEQFADEHGISWPRALAPFAVHLVALGKPGTPERDAAEELYRTLSEGGVEVLYDDRDLGPGEKFADAELLGCPLRLTRRAPVAGVRGARGPGAPRPRVRPGAAPERRIPTSCCGRWTSCGGASPRAPRAGRGGRRCSDVRRLFGLDRSGPPPPQTRAGQPLRPWTVPNAIGFARLALIPVFLIVGSRSSDGTGALQAALFAVIAWGDYADGIAARVTGPVQPPGRADGPRNRPPARDRGRGRRWRFELLPRWALARARARASC